LQLELAALAKRVRLWDDGHSPSGDRRPRDDGRGDRAARDRGGHRSGRHGGGRESWGGGPREDHALFSAARSRKGSSRRARATRRLRGSPFVTEMGELAACDLVIEAVFEDLEAKRAVFAALERVCPAKTILATKHLGALGGGHCRRARASGARGRHALLQSGPADAARRGRPRRAHEGRRGRRCLRAREAARPRPDPLRGHARVRRQPRLDPPAERLRAGARPRRG